MTISPGGINGASFAERSEIVVLGRFPPPVDGQSVATRRLADLLSDVYRVTRLNTNYEEKGVLEFNSWLVPGRWLHYFRLSGRNRRALRNRPGSVILWPAVSPDSLGHFRDLLTVIRHKRKDQLLVAIIHRGNFSKLFTNPLTRVTAGLVRDNVDLFVFLDKTLSDACADWIPANKRTTIPNAIEDSVTGREQDTVQKQGKGLSEPFRIVYISNMIASKGYGDLLDATKLLVARGAAVETTFVGRWPSKEDESAFYDRLTAYELEDVVRMIPGLSDRTEIQSLHLQAHAFVLPTYYENEAQPLSIIEALSAATPVISTRHRGVPLMLDDTVEGFLVSPKSPEDIANAVQKLMDEELWQIMSKAARARFERQFHADVVRQQWLELIDDVVEGGSCAE